MWEPIKDLPENWRDLASDALASLARVWDEQAEELRGSQAYQNFMDRMRRRIAIETGIIERLYYIDRGITETLIEHGILEALIPHGATDRPAAEVVVLVRDHEDVLEGLFKFVSGQRPLSTSYIKELHQALTRHQEITTALDPFDNLVTVKLLRGEWKKWPNNPTRPDGMIYQYCPPEQTAPQMEQLVRWHLEHEAAGVSPEVEAAWLHHRFTQIHPFQDGNGRVARMLASLVFIKAGWFPLVVTRDDRVEYIEALEAADTGDLEMLVRLFVRAQKKEFVKALSLSREVLEDYRSVQEILSAAVEKLQKYRETGTGEAHARVEAFARVLSDIAFRRFGEVKSEVERSLQNVVADFKVSLTKRDSQSEPMPQYFITKIGQLLNYSPNLNFYAILLAFTITIGKIHTTFLVSFHVFGPEHRGVMACSAGIYRRAYTVGDNFTDQDLQPLSQNLFQFSYLDDPAKLQDRFHPWLEEIIIAGLDYWRKGL
ncbi:MAG: Fic family protein [Anaerolineae bacterium]|nr:Fic family protein [Anaerolineae bacterium]